MDVVVIAMVVIVIAMSNVIVITMARVVITMFCFSQGSLYLCRGNVHRRHNDVSISYKDVVKVVITTPNIVMTMYTPSL
jgi:hypothetical protein